MKASDLEEENENCRAWRESIQPAPDLIDDV